jgi:biotin carboxyl carrier protein
MPAFFLKSGEAQLRVEIQTLEGIPTFKIGEKSFAPSFKTNPERSGGIFKVEERLVSFFFVLSKNKINVWVDGKIYNFEILERKSEQKNKVVPLSSRQIEAPMPGRILKFLTKEGASFKEGDPLVVIESMKMEMNLSAPCAGKVKKIACSENSLVEMGEVLMEFEQEDI